MSFFGILPNNATYSKKSLVSYLGRTNVPRRPFCFRLLFNFNLEGETAWEGAAAQLPLSRLLAVAAEARQVAL